ncbi:hypothetical protein DAPPUDRAFT_318017 [Daphnia pulex]|uniref:Uncharacterized protein n=1 Tax=Daphnia pulex TaxID=6669 RepID=E9GHL8_DAPPU|nr:hypothetical protein DAPPUDRAFT_318017 [Daphnia pulex]|eukprot:EFX81035.1 hypothetical protein DAPPUDRAFT_318017 [Daphnia pulex]
MRDRIAHQQATQQAKEKAEEETNWQRSLSAKNDAHQKVITQRQIEEDLARMRDRIAHQQAMKQSQRATSTFPTVSNPEKGADDPAPIPPPDSKLRSVPALSPLERPATSLDVSQPFPNNSQLIKSSCTFQVLEDPVSTEIHQPPDSNQEKMASFSQSEGPATSLDSSANFLPPDSKPESAAAPSFSERPAASLDKRQSSPKDHQKAVLSLLRWPASVLGKQHDSTSKKTKSTPSIKPIILETQNRQENPDEGELPSEEAPEADDDKQPDLTASLEEFRNQNSPTRKRLERVTPLCLDKESAKAENLIDQLLRVKLSIQVSNTNLSQQLINVFVLVTEVRSKNLQFVWDPGGGQ